MDKEEFARRANEIKRNMEHESFASKLRVYISNFPITLPDDHELPCPAKYAGQDYVVSCLSPICAKRTACVCLAMAAKLLENETTLQNRGAYIQKLRRIIDENRAHIVSVELTNTHFSENIDITSEQKRGVERQLEALKIDLSKQKLEIEKLKQERNKGEVILNRVKEERDAARRRIKNSTTDHKTATSPPPQPKTQNTPSESILDLLEDCDVGVTFEGIFEDILTEFPEIQDTDVWEIVKQLENDGEIEKGTDDEDGSHRYILSG
jgi:hypothetical protein